MPTKQKALSIGSGQRGLFLCVFVAVLLQFCFQGKIMNASYLPKTCSILRVYILCGSGYKNKEIALQVRF